MPVLCCLPGTCMGAVLQVETTYSSAHVCMSHSEESLPLSRMPVSLPDVTCDPYRAS